MSLVSNLFLLFILAAVVLYYLVPGRFQWVVLLVFSYLYYMTGNAKCVVYILFSTIVTYAAALLIERSREKGAAAGKQKAMVIIGILLNLGMLGVVKYADFVIENLNLLFRSNLKGFNILLPLGISFFTFQSTGYMLDVYWKKAKAEKNFFRYALFVSFFPQLMQGPISNYRRLAPQLTESHSFDWHNISFGVQRMIWGFAKKMIIADWAAVFVDAIWGDLDRYNGITLFALVLYGIQLYADFSGAMDVVLGISNLLGIRIEENFRRPYLATSMADFWKRWHVSLGSWMMNYVFYPISLSKWMMKFSKWTKAKFGRVTGRVIPIALADLITFFLVGIWHGASWNYVVYGLVNGIIIAFSELMGPTYRNWKKALHISGKEPWYYGFTLVRTFILVILRYYFVRSVTLTQGLYMVKLSFTHFDLSQILDIPAGSGGTAFAPWALLIIAAGCIVMITVGIFQEKGYHIRESLSKLPVPVTAAIYLVLLVLIGVFGTKASPRGFIYAQF
ncbi:MAG: MBOAT family protein [Blautia sp.]|nr:MBOAT family protein [Blautia sp.]